jgi:hypothetical protein
MRSVFVWLLLGALAPLAAAQEEEAAKRKHERLLELFRNEAAGYTIYRDAHRKEKLELQREPVYVWTNPVRSGGQDGAVFVWTSRGCAQVIGGVHSSPATGPRRVSHEFQSLSLSALDVEHDGGSGWTPEGQGVELAPVEGAPKPATTPGARLVQMRALGREFSARTIDQKDTRWELRILPKPLFRDESQDPQVLDGAVFGFVSSAGTDLEALLLLEARRPAGDSGGDPVWQYGVGRFTDLELTVRLRGKEVFTVPRVQWNSARQDPKHRYRTWLAREIPAIDDDPAKPIE